MWLITHAHLINNQRIFQYKMPHSKSSKMCERANERPSSYCPGKCQPILFVFLFSAHLHPFRFIIILCLFCLGFCKNKIQIKEHTFPWSAVFTLQIYISDEYKQSINQHALLIRYMYYLQKMESHSITQNPPHHFHQNVYKCGRHLICTRKIPMSIYSKKRKRCLNFYRLFILNATGIIGRIYSMHSTMKLFRSKGEQRLFKSQRFSGSHA